MMSREIRAVCESRPLPDARRVAAAVLVGAHLMREGRPFEECVELACQQVEAHERAITRVSLERVASKTVGAE